MAAGKRRKILIGIWILVAGVIALLLIAPLWVPWLLRPALEKYGATFGSYKRIGYDRLQLTGVSYVSSNATFSAKSMEFHQPTVWLWRYLSQQFTKEDVLVEDWQVAITRRERKKRSSDPTSIPEIIETVDSSMAQIQSWIETAHFKSGSFTMQGQAFLIPDARWERGSLTAELITTNIPHAIILSGQFSSEPKKVDIRIPAIDIEGKFQVASRSIGVSELDGVILWKTNAAKVAATFADDALYPSKASIASEHLRIPADLLRLQGYRDLEGSLAAQWETNTFALQLDALGSPLDETNLPPVIINVQATGDTNRIKIEHAALAAPWLKANLSTNVVFDFSGRLLSPEAALHIEVDLNQQSVVQATGRFAGEAFLQRSDGKYPYARFRLSSEGFAGYDVRLDAVNIAGDLDWPWLNLENAHIVFEDGGVAHAAGRYQMIDRAFSPSTIKLNGQVGHEFLPPDLTYTNISLSALFSGPLTALKHSGKIDISGVRHKESGALRVASEWEGNLLDFKKLSINSQILNTSVSLAGSGRVTTNSVELHLENGSVRTKAGNVLDLQRPANLKLDRAEEWNFKLDDLALKGTADLHMSADVQWPQRGSVQLTGTNITSRMFEDYLGPEFPQIDLKHLGLKASWSNGPVLFSATSNARFTYEKTNSFLLRLDGVSDPTGVDLKQFEVLAKVGPVLSGTGRLPLRIVPAEQPNIFQFSRQGAIDFRARTLPNTQLWDEIARLTKVRLLEPNVQLEISGSLQDPIGHVRFEAASAAWTQEGKIRIPPLTDIKADLNLSEQRVQLTYFSGLIEGQPISLQAELPIDTRTGQDWKQFVDWNKASGRVLIENAKFAPFVKYLPDILVPQGTMNAEVSFAKGLQFSGYLTIQDAATRPLPNSGPLQDVYARLRFVKRAIEFEKVHALLGGQPVDFLGRIDLGTNAPGGLPLIDLFLQGENIPLARRTDLILRTDLNLRLSNLTNAVPQLSGEVRLRDSFYLGDLRQLIPGRVASPKRRPPYFSFEEPPFADWLMNIQVTGENFLRARSPLFRGSMSANLRLTGPLKEPVALGEMRTETGTVVFPFANFQVVQGYVTLTSDDPYRPQVLVNGTSRAFGYDLGMTLTGPADRPIIEFTSTPPLTSEQIILMVTAGEVPRRGFGFNTEQRAQRLALFVGKNILSRFSDNAGAERLSITTGEEISEQGRETYALEYRINENWSIVGEYDRFGALNVGMKWRIYSR